MFSLNIAVPLLVQHVNGKLSCQHKDLLDARASTVLGIVLVLYFCPILSLSQNQLTPTFPQLN